MRQKFRTFEVVTINERNHQWESNDRKGMRCIIDKAEYRNYHEGDSIEYSVYLLDGGKVINHISWFNENQLSKVNVMSKEAAEDLIIDYRLGQR